jgi:hypothetical protein
MHANLSISLLWLGSPHFGLAARMMRSSEPSSPSATSSQALGRCRSSPASAWQKLLDTFQPFHEQGRRGIEQETLYQEPIVIFENFLAALERVSSQIE